MSSPVLQKVGHAAAQIVSPQQVQPAQPQEFVRGATVAEQHRVSQVAAQESAIRHVESKRRTSQRPPRVEGSFAGQEQPRPEDENSTVKNAAKRQPGSDKVNIVA